MFLPKVLDKLGPSVVCLGAAHEVIDDWIRVTGYLLIDVAKLELGVGDGKAVKGCIHATQPCIDVPGIKGWETRLLISLLAGHCGCNGGLDYRPVVRSRVALNVVRSCCYCCGDDRRE